MKIVIIDYGAGNTKSVEFAFKRCGFEAELSDDSTLIEQADGVIFPGVGHANQAMETLKKKGLDNVIKNLKQPVLGICLGMQLMCTRTEEGNEDGLGIFNTPVVKFGNELKVPQIGWNSLESKSGELFYGISKRPYLYFVHSYFVPENSDAIGVANYGLNFSAAIQKDNFYGCQFHPEKSGKDGETVIKNFIKICKSYQQ